MVKYIDFAKDRVPDGSFAAQFYCKRRSFEHERELRAMLLQFPLDERGERPDYERHPDDAGLRIAVSVSDLIEDVYVAPEAPHWYVDLVSSVVKAYGFPVSPRQSELDATPVY